MRPKAVSIAPQKEAPIRIPVHVVEKLNKIGRAE